MKRCLVFSEVVAVGPLHAWLAGWLGDACVCVCLYVCVLDCEMLSLYWLCSLLEGSVCELQ